MASMFKVHKRMIGSNLLITFYFAASCGDIPNEDYTGLYSHPTRRILTGKLSKRTAFRNLEAELELYRKLLTVASSEHERKRFDDAIKWIEKEIEKYD